MIVRENGCDSDDDGKDDAKVQVVLWWVLVGGRENAIAEETED